jgi:hypothetical protein
MKRYIRAVAAAAIVTGGLGSAGCATHSGCTNQAGCQNGGSGSLEDHYRNWYDANWPERYNFAARESVLYPFAQQAATGHFLDQTLWNWHFEPGSDKLSPAGMEKLDAISHATPSPDPRLYIQTARDILVTSDNADKAGALREDLNIRRAAAVKRYAASQPGAPVPYEVYVHDAPVPSIYAPFAVAAFNAIRSGYGKFAGGSSSGGTGGGANGQPAAPLTTVNNVTAPGGGGAGGGGGGGSAPAASPGTGSGSPSSGPTGY